MWESVGPFVDTGANIGILVVAFHLVRCLTRIEERMRLNSQAIDALWEKMEHKVDADICEQLRER